MCKIYITDKGVAISEDTISEWKKQLNNYGKLYMCAMSGFGKTTISNAFAEKQFSQWINISAGEKDFLQRIADYIEKNKNTRVRTLLILDDLQWLSAIEDQEKLVELIGSLKEYNDKLQCILLSRADLPAYLKPLYLTGKLGIINNDTFWLSEQHIEAIIRKENIIKASEKIAINDVAKHCLNISMGYPVLVRSIIRQLKEGNRDFAIMGRLARDDVFEYFQRMSLTNWTEEQRKSILKLAVYSEFNMEMAEVVLGKEAGRIINSISEMSSFLKFVPQDKYQIQGFFLNYLRDRQKNLGKAELERVYNAAGEYYESVRNLKQALRCYKGAGRSDKIARLVIYLSENVDSDFIKISGEYLDDISEEMEDKYPKLLGVKILLLSYQMKIEQSNKCLKKLRQKAEEEKKSSGSGEILETYFRTIIALPYNTAEEVKDNLTMLFGYILKHGFKLKNIIPTGNMPSVLNGGLDFLSFTKRDRMLYPIMKKLVETVIGMEAIGLIDVAMGENFYQKNNITEAMKYLTKGLSDSNSNGSIRVQYAAAGVMAKIFQSELQPDMAEDALKNIYNKSINANFMELIPNIRASLVYCSLLRGDTQKITDWLENYAPNEHAVFYTTDRFVLFIKAMVYVSIGKYVGALYILDMLNEYAVKYNRNYVAIEIKLLKSIILFRRGEPWEKILLEAVQKAAEYSFVHIISDYGNALIPLWKKIEPTLSQIKKGYIDSVNYELTKMAIQYPNYLKGLREAEVLSKKESEVIKLMAEGYTNKEIAFTMGLSIATVKFHVANILRKLEAENRTIAVKIAQDKEII